jgi:hypothetical protein
MEQQSSRGGRWAFGLTVLAFAWGIALLVVAFVFPMYGSSTASAPSGVSVPSASSTLVGVNGLGMLVPVGLPTLIAAVVWFALHRKCSRGSRPSSYVAWWLIWLLIAFCLVAIASIGMFVLPVAAFLAGAALLTPSGTQPGPVSAA